MRREEGSSTITDLKLPQAHKKGRLLSEPRARLSRSICKCPTTAWKILQLHDRMTNFRWWNKSKLNGFPKIQILKIRLIHLVTLQEKAFSVGCEISWLINFLLAVTTPGISFCKLILKGLVVDEEEMQETSTSLAPAKPRSTDRPNTRLKKKQEPPFRDWSADPT